MTLIPLYYATKGSPCKSYLPLSVKPCRHLLRTPNGASKGNSASLLCFIPGLRFFLIISIFTASFLQGPYPFKKTDGYRPKNHSSLGSNRWKKSLINAICKICKRPISKKSSSSQAIQLTLSLSKNLQNWHNLFQRLSGLPTQNVPLPGLNRYSTTLDDILTA